jgi:hypothetical protein
LSNDFLKHVKVLKHYTLLNNYYYFHYYTTHYLTIIMLLDYYTSITITTIRLRDSGDRECACCKHRSAIPLAVGSRSRRAPIPPPIPMVGCVLLIL